jgi:HAD superfamily hydrolase (TIGR01509 family)
MGPGWPDGAGACLFDLDGVLTETASVHAAARKEMFDSFLQGWAGRHSAGQQRQPFEPFDRHDDYGQDFDGKPRLDGVRDFPASRGIRLPKGTADDPAAAGTVDGLGRGKNDLVLRRMDQDGVAAYPGSWAYVRAARDAGLLRVVVSSSNNCRDVLAAAHILDLFQEIVDSLLAERKHLRGKQAPDTYLAGARLLGAEPSVAAAFEDALAGVESGRAGHFGWVVGVDRVGQAEAPKEHGADRVVRDLGELLDQAAQA